MSINQNFLLVEQNQTLHNLNSLTTIVFLERCLTIIVVHTACIGRFMIKLLLVGSWPLSFIIVGCVMVNKFVHNVIVFFFLNLWLNYTKYISVCFNWVKITRGDVNIDKMHQVNSIIIFKKLSSLMKLKLIILNTLH